MMVTRRHSSIRTSVWEEDEYAYALGTHVMTEDGYPGIIYDRQIGPFGSLETYFIELDDGVGGGEYLLDDIVGPIEKDGEVVPGIDVESRRYSDTPLVCDKCGRTAVTSTSGGRDGHTQLCPECRDEQKADREQRKQAAGDISTAFPEDQASQYHDFMPHTLLTNTCSICGRPFHEHRHHHHHRGARADLPLAERGTVVSEFRPTLASNDLAHVLVTDAELASNGIDLSSFSREARADFYDLVSGVLQTSASAETSIVRNGPSPLRVTVGHVDLMGSGEQMLHVVHAESVVASMENVKVSGIFDPDSEYESMGRGHAGTPGLGVRSIPRLAVSVLVESAGPGPAFVVWADGEMAKQSFLDGDSSGHAVDAIHKNSARMDLPLLSPEDADAEGWHVATTDYPELQSILWDRPDHIEAQSAGIGQVSLGAKTATTIKDLLQDKKTPWLFRHVTGPAADRANEALPPGYKMDDITQVMGDNNWCRFRRDSNCFFPKELDARATEAAGYDVWIPELRGHCARHRFDDQKACPISEPGPKSGEPNWKPDATRRWDQGGQRVSVRIAANKTYCSNCDEMVRYKLDAAGLWDCSQCGSAIECSECGDPMSARHEHNRFGDAALTESQEEFRKRMRDKWLSKRAAAWFEMSPDMQRVLDYLRSADGSRTYAEIGPATGVLAVAATCQALRRRQLIDFTFDDDQKVHRWSITPGGMQRNSAWTDVRDKGKRIRTDGGVRIIANTGTTVTAEVRGDNGIYISSITRVPGTKQRGMWYCGCKWTQYVWARSEPYKRFEGRPCSHSMALWFEMQGREMFGGTITDDPETPSWRTSEPQASWAEGLEFESAIDDSNAKMAIDNISDSLRVAQSVESSSSLSAAISSLEGIRSMGSTSEEFKAKVRGLVVDVQVVDGVPVAGGQTVAPTEVFYPTYDPVAGLYFVGAKTAAEIVVKHPVADGTSSVATIPDDQIDAAAAVIDGMSLSIDHGNASGIQVLEDLLTDAGIAPVDMHDDMSDFMADVADGDGGASGIFPMRVQANITREAAEHTGVMVALSPSRDLSARLSKLAADAGLDPEPPEEIHLTLAYCGKTTEIDKDSFMGAVRAFAAQHSPFSGKIQGLGTFLNDEGGVLWASADIGGLAAARTSLCEALLVAGTPAKTDHDFTPHITLAYSNESITELPNYKSVVGAEMTFSTLVAAYGGEWSHFDLLGSSGEIMAVEKMGKVDELATVVRGIIDLSGQIGDRLMAAYAVVDDTEGMRTVEDECAKGDYTHAGVIIKALDSGRVLMTQRTPHHMDEDGTFGKWEFPGGGLDPGEDPIKGALREFTEETGLMLPDGWHVEGCQPSGNYLGIVITVPYEAWTTDAELLDRETMGIGWFDPDVDNTEESIVREELQETDWEMVVEARNISDSLRGSADSVPYKPVTATTPEAVKHDEPEPALPEVYGDDEMPDVPFVPGDPRLSHLAPSAGESSEDIAGAAAAFLAKSAVKDFSSAEQATLINEGSDEHIGASNTDRLDLTGTFYEQGAEDDELVFY